MFLSHEDLIDELPKLEKLSATERKRLNDNRRAQQIVRWESQDGGIEKYGEQWPPQHPRKRKKLDPHFDPGLVLLNCTALGDYEGVKSLLNEGVSPTVYNIDRITPLHQSCLENNEEITELLMSAGCDIDSLDNELWTPLHAAVSLSNLECVVLLLKHNADQLSPNVDGQLPIDLCEDKQILAIMDQDLLQKGITQKDLAAARTSQGTKFFNDVRHLLEGGGNPNFQLLDNDATLLHVAAANGFVEVALYLLSKCCKVDVQDIDGWTPLHAAAFWGEVDIIELLAAHGADFKIRTFCGELPIDLTEDEDIRNLLQRLSERSELMKRHPGAVLRPSSVRGRLVSRMTTDEREDKRRESGELHSVFIEQIEEDFTKAPDSWRIRTGKYVRPSLRDISFEPPVDICKKQPDSMNDSSGTLSPKPLLERSVSIPLSDSSDLSYSESNTIESLNTLSAICENGENKDNSAVCGGKQDKLTREEQKLANHNSFQRDLSSDAMGASSLTFDAISEIQSAESLVDNEKEDKQYLKQWFPNISKDESEDSETTSLICANKTNTELRKQKSFEDLVDTDDDLVNNEYIGYDNSKKSILRSASLSQPRESTQRLNVTRYHSFRQNMHEAPRYSPKPKSNKSGYKNRKKASVSKQSFNSDETLTHSNPSSAGDLNCTVFMPKEEAEVNNVPVPDEPVGAPCEPKTVTPPPPCEPDLNLANNTVEKSTEPPATEPDSAAADSNNQNSMATNADSLDGRPQQMEMEEKKKKSNKCCVIL